MMGRQLMSPTKVGLKSTTNTWMQWQYKNHAWCLLLWMLYCHASFSNKIWLNHHQTIQICNQALDEQGNKLVLKLYCSFKVWPKTLICKMIFIESSTNICNRLENANINYLKSKSGWKCVTHVNLSPYAKICFSNVKY
jgi:hypothetical protein